MKRKFLFITSWILVISSLVYFDVLPVDTDTIKHFISDKEEYAPVLFIIAWIVRLLFLIPGTPLIILGGVSFDPLQGFILSTIGLLVSGSLIYFLSRSIIGKEVKISMLTKHRDLYHLLKVHNYKILALGMICPIVPSDALCFLSAATGVKYSTYIITIVIANTPLRLLYSYMGINFTNSALGLSLSVISILLIFIVSIKIWKTLNRQANTHQ